MKAETQTKCDKPCKGALFTDLSMSRMEEFLGHKKYTCDSCGKSYKFTKEVK